jgi:hypothetical protein
MNTARPLPLVPSDLPKPARAIPRAAWASLQSAMKGGNAVDHCARLFPRDEIARAMLERAATTGATTTGAGWAAELINAAVWSWLGSLAPESAMATILARGSLIVQITDQAPISIPGRASPPGGMAGWVGEGAPIAAKKFAFTSVSLAPKKLGCIIVFSRELARLSSAQEIFNMMLREEAAAEFDRAFLSSAAGDLIVHRGLLAGLTPIVGSAIFLDDLAKLAESVGGTTGSGEVMFVMCPGRSAAAKLRQPTLPGKSCRHWRSRPMPSWPWIRSHWSVVLP